MRPRIVHCYPIAANAAQLWLSNLDKVHNRLRGLVGNESFSTLPLLSHKRNIPNLLLRYHCYYDRCSYELHPLVSSARINHVLEHTPIPRLFFFLFFLERESSNHIVSSSKLLHSITNYQEDASLTTTIFSKWEKIIEPEKKNIMRKKYANTVNRRQIYREIYWI